MDYFVDLDYEQAIGLVLAIVFGAVIGLERQMRKHAAGLHTNALVALGAAAYVIAGMSMGDATAPARIVGQVVVGVGFVCAGLIWHKNGTVSGINTAATVWCSCAVGIFPPRQVRALLLSTYGLRHSGASKSGAKNAVAFASRSPRSS